MPCSDEYWEAVEPVFDLLKQEKNYGTKWSEIADKSQKVYIPLLQAFIDEINRATQICRMQSCIEQKIMLITGMK